MADQQPGWCYLLHFTQPFGHAQHYIGATGLPLGVPARLAAHRGQGYPDPATRPQGPASKLVHAVLASGGDFVLADSWACGSKAEAFALERWLKRQKRHRAICSVCSPGSKIALTHLGTRTRHAGQHAITGVIRGETDTPPAQM